MSMRPNPLLTPSSLPFAAPPFDTIRDEDFAPAFEAGMRAEQAEVAGIAGNPAPPTFENTLTALESCGQLLNRVGLIFNGLTSANTNPVLQQIHQDVAPKLAAHEDAIFHHGALFARVEAVHAQRHTLGLDAESLRLADHYYREFVRAGARLCDADKAALKALNEEDAALSAKYISMLLDATKESALVIDDVTDLAGLSAEAIATAAEAATARGLPGAWLIPLHNTTQHPLLASLTNRATRERLYRASVTRTERGDANDTRQIVTRLASLRAQKAGLLGYPTYAAWVLEDQMARTPAAAEAFLARLIPAAVANARAEARAIQAHMASQGGTFLLEPWDWDFYAEQVRKATHDLDDATLTPYFELERTLRDGVFYAAQQLYGISFTERRDLPVYHPDVRVFEVIDADEAPMALFYADLFARDNKNGGAWMDNYVVQSTLLGTKPVICNVANVVKPTPGQPALLSLDEVTTLFHEFGHALHGLFANQRYPSVSGTSVPRDFVELPSQFNEHWALDPEVLVHYAVHHQTGDPIPDDLADRVRTAVTFNQGYSLTEILAAAVLDLRWHSLPAGAPEPSPDVFEATALEGAGLDLPQVPPRYRSSYFLHIWANGYAAGYYAYLWAEMLDNDAFAWFTEHGGLTRANGDRFRRLILSRGNAGDFEQMYREFRGHDPSIEPMLRRRGITA
ncbi:MAG: M3 family metallopeptidase [Vicinamibacterales bacterium]|nr:M3 family metallopeptidase [Vicinamibacterales bacterium]